MQPMPQNAPEQIRFQLFELMMGLMRTQAISVAVRLGIPDLVSSEPMDVGEIARRVGADEAALHRLLRHLVTIGIFAVTGERSFSATPLSDGLREDAPATARWLALMLGEEHYAAWGNAIHSFVTGEPAFETVHGRPMFDFFEDDPERGEIFNHAMAAGARARAAALVRHDWMGVSRVADIGGGSGTAIAGVLAANPHLHGVLFDLPAVVTSADDVLDGAGVRDRCEVVGGDFFRDDLPPADVYVLSQILHDWDDERAGAILANCRRSLSTGDRLLLVEMALSDDADSEFERLFDLHMLVLLGGKERTEAEWRSLLGGNGFEPTSVGGGLIEARPV